jgi:para-aminobenzoate synthetase
MKTLVIDHYDSFTFNLAHLLTQVNGEAPIVVAHDRISWDEISQLEIDNILLSPGPGRPGNDGDFVVSAEAIRHSELPILGVCLGHQGIAHLHGATVTEAPHPVHGRISRIHHKGDVLFKGIPSPFEVVRYHSLVALDPLPEPLVATAWTEDGLIMALRHRERPIWGVQFHPESILTEYGDRLLANFRDLTRALQEPRVHPAPEMPEPEPDVVAESLPRRTLWRELPMAVDTEAAFVTLYGASPTAFWLDSSLVVQGRSRWSFLGEAGSDGSVVTYNLAERTLERHSQDGALIEAWQQGVFEFLQQAQGGPIDNPPPCPFSGGHVGWLGYELHGECDGPIPVRPANTPDALLIEARRFIAVDHISGRTYVIALLESDQEGDAAQTWIDATSWRLTNLPALLPVQPGRSGAPVAFTLDRDRATYLADIAQSLDWITEGETYQVCLTNELSCDQNGLDPLELYRVQRLRNPAPHAAYVRWPGGVALSASPERYLSIDRAGLVQARPIKGTIRRSPDPTLDHELGQRLASSEKDRAENLMIVDLLRNDLSRVCVSGSVAVPSLMALESYATVHQLVSTVEGRLEAGKTGIDAIQAAFPGGSMTGAPKHRTIELIDRLEQRARGVYSGALGWIGADGAADLSIVIRTIVAVGGKLAIGVGGGIVAQSTLDGEFDEMLLKAKGSIESIVAAATGRGDSGLFSIAGAEGAAAPLAKRSQ